MKIHETAAGMPSITGTVSKDERKNAASRTSGFQSSIETVEVKNFEEKLYGLADKIMQQGEKLSKKVDIGEFKIYRKLLSEFLDNVVGESFKFSQESFLDRRGRHRIYALVRKIDSEIEQLAKDVLETEKNHIKILKRIDDIRGLIMDILM